jgi:hypothetical protein
MEHFIESNIFSDYGYHGNILLSDEYSASLKHRLAECIKCYRAFENTGSAAMLYIAAWTGNDKRIWYEYAGQNFVNFFECEQHEIVDIFRKSIQDRHIYKTLDLEVGVEKEVKSNDEVGDAWKELREEGKKAGTMEAVYKLSIGQGNTTWLKDQATIEV